MLKIKDNIDLKELERFNFHWNDELEYYEYKIFSPNKSKHQEIIVGAFDVVHEREIVVRGFGFDSHELMEVYDYILDTLYILIKEGLVEEEVFNETNSKTKA